MTLVAIWFGWNVITVRQRAAMWTSLEVQGYVTLDPRNRTWAHYRPPTGPTALLREFMPKPRADVKKFWHYFIRERLGDQYRQVIYYSGPKPQSVQHQFPEAHIMIPAATK
jgi:hypothetical protein